MESPPCTVAKSGSRERVGGLLPAPIALPVAFLVALLVACGGSPPPTAPPPSPTISAVPARPASLPPPALVEVTVLDTNERAPRRLPTDPTFVRAASAVLRELAGCRAKAGSKGHWVRLEWRFDPAGRATKVVAHQVHVPPADRPRPLSEEARSCMEAAAGTPVFAGAKVGVEARVFALVGFELPDDHGAAPLRPGERFTPLLEGQCQLDDVCPPEKRCEEPPRVRCPRALEAP